MRARIFTALVSLLLALLCNVSPGFAGPEFDVNQIRKNAQHSPSAAILANGDVIVCWTSTREDSSTDVKCRYLGPSGNPIGPEFFANTKKAENQEDPSVVALDDGGFMVTWASFDGDNWTVVARRFDKDGDGSEPFTVNRKTDDHQLSPSITQLKNGGYVVTWVDVNRDTGEQNVIARVYDKNNDLVRDEFLVNQVTNGHQTQPAVAALPSGNFAIVWTSYSSDGFDAEIMVQIFNPKGIRVGNPFRANTETDNFQVLPAIVTIVDKIIVAWQSLGQDGSLGGIYGRIIDAAGRAANREFRINTHTPNWQERPTLAPVQNGFAVFWESEGQDGSGRGIFGRVYSHNGKPVTQEFRANTTKKGGQVFPSAAGSADDRNFSVFWSSFTLNGLDSEIIGRNFLAPTIPPP